MWGLFATATLMSALYENQGDQIEVCLLAIVYFLATLTLGDSWHKCWHSLKIRVTRLSVLNVVCLLAIVYILSSHPDSRRPTLLTA
jgi:hypothetical protein